MSLKVKYSVKAPYDGDLFRSLIRHIAMNDFRIMMILHKVYDIVDDLDTRAEELYNLYSRYFDVDDEEEAKKFFKNAYERVYLSRAASYLGLNKIVIRRVNDPINLPEGTGIYPCYTDQTEVIGTDAGISKVQSAILDDPDFENFEIKSIVPVDLSDIEKAVELKYKRYPDSKTVKALIKEFAKASNMILEVDPERQKWVQELIERFKMRTNEAV